MQPTVSHENDFWVIRVPSETGKMQEYRCSSESQVKQLLLVLAPPLPSAPPSA